MCAVVVISIMFGAVIVMVKKADKEGATMRITEEDCIRLKLIKR